MTVRAWWELLRRHGFRIHRRNLARAAVISAITASNMPAALLQSILFGRSLRAAAVAPDPVFILGHYRSGTTHLHNLLALDERLSYPTLYQCAAPHHCLVTGGIYPRLFSWMLPARRLQDGMVLGFSLPQEDELGLIALGAPSPYWSMGFPAGSPGEAFLGLTAVSEAERRSWAQIFLGLLRLVSLRHPGRPLVLKSPPHTARIAVLSRLFPAARFVHIVRDPLAVFASSVSLWRVTRAANALAAYNEAAAGQEVLDGLLQLYQDFPAATAALPRGQFHQLRYEDLVQHPLATLEDLYRALGLGDFAAVRPRIEAYLAGQRAYRRNEYEVSAEGREAVRAAWGPLFRPWGYEMADAGAAPASADSAA
jgi:omega-hydroxy-beta-dihydromenaquinone-9 sulfotransferase